MADAANTWIRVERRLKGSDDAWVYHGVYSSEHESHEDTMARLARQKPVSEFRSSPCEGLV